MRSFSSITLFLVIVNGCKTCESSVIPQENSTCHGIILSALSGTIKSPNYPLNPPEGTSCSWIVHTPPNSHVQIDFKDLYIEEEEEGDYHSRAHCMYNWVSFSTSDEESETRKFCRRNSMEPLVLPILPKNKVIINFNYSKSFKNGKGFQLQYYVLADLKSDECYEKNKVPCGASAEDGCFDNITERCDGIFNCQSKRDELGCRQQSSQCELKCSNFGCYSYLQRCDRKPDCTDYSDEFNCKFCPPGKVLCNANPGMNDCFSPELEKCNGFTNCPAGEDEIGCFPECDQSFKCATSKECYSKKQRCNSIKDCADNSDEENCPVKCSVGKKICDNGNCIPSQLWCNGIDDCGDGSDEMTCFRNTLIAAAVMGVLLCGLLLIIAVACTCRLYSLRLSHTRFHVSPHLATRLRLNQSVSLPPLIDDEFFHREPPPAYSVAIGDCQSPILQPLQPIAPRQMNHVRRVRRFGSNRRYSRSYALQQQIRSNCPLTEAGSSLITTIHEPIINNCVDCDKTPETNGRIVDSNSTSSCNSSPAHGGSTNSSSSSSNSTDNTILL